MNYLTEIIYTAIIFGILLRIGPGETAKSRKLVKFLVSLAFLTVLSAPLLTITDSFSGTYERFFGMEEESAAVTYDASSHKATITDVICKTAVKKAAERFSVPEDNFSIKLIVSEKSPSEYSIEKVNIYRKNEASKISQKDVKYFFKDIFKSAKEVIIDD